MDIRSFFQKKRKALSSLSSETLPIKKRRILKKSEIEDIGEQSSNESIQNNEILDSEENTTKLSTTDNTENNNTPISEEHDSKDSDHEKYDENENGSSDEELLDELDDEISNVDENEMQNDIESEDIGKSNTKKKSNLLPSTKESLDKNTTKSTSKSISKSKSSSKSKPKSSTKLDTLKKRYKENKYNIQDDCEIKLNEPVPYLVIAKVFEELEATTKRLKKIDIICNLFRRVTVLKPDELLYVVYLCSNKIAAPYEGIELGVGDQVIMKAISESTGRSLKDIKADLQKLGDLGKVAQASRKKQSTMYATQPLTSVQVFNTFKKVALTSGHQSVQEKSRNIQKLFVSAREMEAKYIVRHLQGKMRMGVNEQTVFAALAKSCAFTPPATNPIILDRSKTISLDKLAKLELRYIDLIKQVFSELPNYELVMKALTTYGIDNIKEHCHLTPGIPIKVMLAKPSKGVGEILKRFKDIKFTLEYKYDGERAQIHFYNNTVKIFSRNAEDNTEKYPDLVRNIPKYCNSNTTSFILDGEVVAYDRIEKKLLPFQILTQRKRKDVKEADVSVQVCVYAFDCLYLNGESLIEKPFCYRRSKLYENFNSVEGQFAFADHKDTTDPEEITDYLNKAVESSCEGLMVKTLDTDATYQPSKRSHNWLKCKKDYLDGIGDTLDLVVMGAFYGAGKRTGYFGSYLVGCYDDNEDSYQSITKVATGLSDEDLHTHTESLKLYLKDKKPLNYQSKIECDVWFEPKIVWEIKCADLTISPVHFAGVGLVHNSKGIGLRFPRFIRIRNDKEPENSTTSSQVIELYNKQKSIDNPQTFDMDIDD